MAKPDLIAEARKRWQRCAEAEADQRKRMLLAKRFRAGDQWDPAIKLQREGGNAIQGQSPQPARPCLTVDRLSQPLRQQSNIIKHAEFGITVLPNGGGADVDTADIFKGYLRRVQNAARGESPIEWAGDGGIECGLGWFRIRTEYVHETWDGAITDPAVMDQELRLERIPNSLSVYCDPAAMKPTRSDAVFMFVTEDMSRDEYEQRYPKSDVAALEDFMTDGDNQGWVTDKAIRIAEYWRITYQDRTIYQMDDGRIVEGEKPDTGTVKAQRTMRVPIVKCDKINAVQSLEQYEWLGSRIPLVPVLGEELNVDGKIVLRGIIEEGMDAQRMINYTYSGAMEIFALAPKNAPMVPAQAVASYKQIWQTRNIINHAYLPYDAMDTEGRPLPPPTLDTTEPPIQAAVELMRISEDAVQATTSTGDASLGHASPNEKSGRALQALQAQSDLANSNFSDNVRRALIYAAELMVEVIPKITRPGQIVQILGVDDEPEQVMIGQPYQQNAQHVPQPLPQGFGPQSPGWDKAVHKFFDLNNGRYAVTVDVGKAMATKREEGAAALGDLIPHLPPEMAAVATPDYVEQLDFPGAQGIAEKLRKALPPQLQPQDPNQQIPPQVQAQMQQMGMQLQQAQQYIQTEQAKQQGALQQAQIRAQTEMQKAQLEAEKEFKLQEMKNAASIEVARISAAKSAIDPAAAAAEERLSTGLQMAHEAGMQASEQAHELAMAQHSAATQAASQGAQQAHDAQQAQAAQAAAAQQQDAKQAGAMAQQQQAQQAAAQQANQNGGGQ
jgi:hypothetical protein